MFCIKICFFEAGAGRSRDFMGGAKNVHQESKKKLWSPSRGKMAGLHNTVLLISLLNEIPTYISYFTLYFMTFFLPLKIFYIVIFLLPFTSLKKMQSFSRLLLRKLTGFDTYTQLYHICVEWNGGLEMKTPFLYGLVTAERMTSWHLCRKINIKYGHFYELYTVDSRGVSQQEHITASYRLLLTYRLIKTGLFT